MGDVAKVRLRITRHYHTNTPHNPPSPCASAAARQRAPPPRSDRRAPLTNPRTDPRAAPQGAKIFKTKVRRRRRLQRVPRARGARRPRDATAHARVPNTFPSHARPRARPPFSPPRSARSATSSRRARATSRARTCTASSASSRARRRASPTRPRTRARASCGARTRSSTTSSTPRRCVGAVVAGCARARAHALGSRDD